MTNNVSEEPIDTLDSRSAQLASPAPTRGSTTGTGGSTTGTVGAHRTTVWFAIAPAVLLMFVFLGLPLLQGVRMGFSTWGGVGPIKWAGLANYVSALHNSAVYDSLWTTVKYSVLSTAGIIVVSTLLASAVSSGQRGSQVYRVLWFLPAVAPLTAVSIFWSLAVQPNSGALNVLLGAVGLGSDHSWLAGADSAIYPTVIATVWASVGFAFLLILGAMETVDVVLYEAAAIDGASALRRFLSITLPLIRPVLVTTTMLQIIWTFNGFTVLWAMTKGGPGSSTTVLPVLIYKEAFQFSNFGSASAMAVISGTLLLIFGFITLRLSRSQQAATS